MTLLIQNNNKNRNKFTRIVPNSTILSHWGKCTNTQKNIVMININNRKVLVIFFKFLLKEGGPN